MADRVARAAPLVLSLLLAVVLFAPATVARAACARLPRWPDSWALPY